MSGSITDVAGIRVGHWTDPVARTGCTVTLFPASTIASGEIRGGAPGTREWALLSPERMVDRVDAFVMTGGSAFGLAACDGVVRFCEERGMGFPTSAGPVPIVVGAVLFDLTVGSPSVRPGPNEGYASCVAARVAPIEQGAVGAGTGATVSKWRGPEHARAGGIGTASCSHAGLVVGALIAVNAAGDVLQPGDVPDPAYADVVGTVVTPLGENTTIGVVATNAALDKVGCLLVAQSAQDALSRCIHPAHLQADGDAILAASTGPVIAPIESVRALAHSAVQDAVRAAVSAAAREETD